MGLFSWYGFWNFDLWDTKCRFLRFQRLRDQIPIFIIQKFQLALLQKPINIRESIGIFKATFNVSRPSKIG